MQKRKYLVGWLYVLVKTVLTSVASPEMIKTSHKIEKV